MASQATVKRGGEEESSEGTCPRSLRCSPTFRALLSAVKDWRRRYGFRSGRQVCIDAIRLWCCCRSELKMLRRAHAGHQLPVHFLNNKNLRELHGSPTYRQTCLVSVVPVTTLCKLASLKFIEGKRGCQVDRTQRRTSSLILTCMRRNVEGDRQRGVFQPATPRSLNPFLPRWGGVGLFVIMIWRFAVVFDS